MRLRNLPRSTQEVYESESEYAVEDDVVFSMQTQNGEFLQSMMSVDADVDVISEVVTAYENPIKSK